MTRKQATPQYKVTLEMPHGPMIVGTYHSSEIAKLAARNAADLRRFDVCLYHLTARGEELIATMKPRGIE